jgi:multidrug efflux system outer membrane protein
MRARLLLFSVTTLLAGCAVGPSYHRPETQVPATLRAPVAPDERSLADLAWWDLYRDPILTGLVREALTNGYDTRIAAARVEQARGLSLAAGGALWPSVVYGANADRGRNAVFGSANPLGGGSTIGTYDAALSAAWELDVWGRLRRLDEVARAQYLATEEAQRGVRLSLLGEVAGDYFQLLELDEDLAISHDAAESFGESLRLFDMRLRGGVASKLETSSAEAAQAAAAARIPEIEREIAELENNLSVILGRNPGPIARGENLAAHVAPAPDVPAGLPSALLERRPDVRAAEYAAMGANAQIGVAIGNFLPRIGLSAVFGGVSERLQSLTTHQAELWSAGAQLGGPLFQPGTLHGGYLHANAAWEEAKLRYQQAAANAFADASNALTARQKLREIRVQQETEVRAYREAVNVARERYKAGSASYFELLQVQQLLYPAESALAQTHRDELVSLVQLYEALGGGWNLTDPAWLGVKSSLP